MTTPKRDARALLATGGLLLIPLAALWLLVAPARHHAPGGPAPLRPDAGQSAAPERPAPPPPRIAAGAPTQGGWTLRAMTVVPQSSVTSLPAALATQTTMPQPATASAPTFQGTPGAVGLWLDVRGGLGVKTLTIPVDGRRRVFPFGRFLLTAQPMPPPPNRPFSVLVDWRGSGGKSLSGRDGPPPYEVSSSPPFTAPGQGLGETVTLTPPALAGRFRVTAQPLSAGGRPTGRAVRLFCQSATATVLLAQLPPGYSAATQQFRVTAADSRAPGGGAAWRIAGLPPATENGTSAPAEAARVGPFALRGAAVEAEDTSGVGAPEMPAVNHIRPMPPANLDRHWYTGVPTVRVRLTARAVAPPAPGQSWRFQLNRVTPQWGVPPSLMVSPADGPEKPLGLFPLAAPGQGGPEWALQDGEVGAAYPGQQRRVTLEGTAIRFAERTETVTFHDADVVWDAGFGGDRIVWRHPETQTTPSGIIVAVLNGRPGRRERYDAQFGGGGSPGGRDAAPPALSAAWYDRGHAELLLAWRLPAMFDSERHALPASPRVAGMPRGTGPLTITWDDARPDPWMRVTAPPGATSAEALTEAGFSLLRLSVGAPQRPPGTPLPRHLPTLTLQILLREEQERRPVRLVVPVRGLPLKIAP